MSGGKKVRGFKAPTGDREWFVRENAVALIRARDELITRLRKRITQLEQTAGALRRERQRLTADLAAAHAVVESLAERCAGQSAVISRRVEKEHP